MKLVFFWNYLNHHQMPVADEMYKLIGGNFHFVATLTRNDKELKGDEDYSSRPYCILAAESKDAHREAMEYARTADVCLFGACSQQYAIHRAVHNPKGLAFEVGERWLKRGWLNVLSPTLRTWWLNYQRYYRKANFFKLCSSAYAAADDERFGCYKGRHFKWGYFSDIPYDFSACKTIKPEQRIRLMWCARFIRWKHPELAIECAERLKEEGYDFLLSMYGDGPLKVKCEKRVQEVGLSDNVMFRGNVHNTEILRAMRESDIFLFTSDRQEGWGVVANEAMAAGCCLVANEVIGAAPYLIRNGVNGYMFSDATALFETVRRLIDNQQERAQLSTKAREDMTTLWSPRCAAQNLLQLINDLQNGAEISITKGPCSKEILN